jgi:outer membrane protein TolC
VSSAYGGYLPTVSAQTSYQRAGSDLTGPGGVYDDLRREYQASAQLVVSWNLFEGRRTSAEVQRAEAQARRARAAEGQVVAAVTRELADARAVAASTARQVGLAAENVRTAQEGLALARERLDAGLATQLDIRDASLKLTQAELSLVEARIDHQVALADLARATGGTL